MNPTTLCGEAKPSLISGKFTLSWQVLRFVPAWTRALDRDGVLCRLLALRYHGSALLTLSVPPSPAVNITMIVPQATRRCYTEQQIAAVMAGTLEGLIYLHRLNKIHRDVRLP